jgi:hypothetical protein
MAETGDIWSEALAEAYASAPPEEVILHTLELRHPSFTENGVVTPVRVVRDFGELLEEGDPDLFGHLLTLELDAPSDPGQTVRFLACMFDVSLPGQTEGKLPEVEITLDNVTRQVSKYLDAATEEQVPVELTYREYLASDKTAPQFILNGLTLSRVKSNVLRVTGTASFVDLVNKSFPGKVYRPEEFRGLSA